MSDKLTFPECVAVSLENEDLVREWNRLTGRNLGAIHRRPPIVCMIDQSTGFEDQLIEQEKDNLRAFIAFVKDVVWDRLPPDCREVCE